MAVQDVFPDSGANLSSASLSAANTFERARDRLDGNTAGFCKLARSGSVLARKKTDKIFPGNDANIHGSDSVDVGLKCQQGISTYDDRHLSTNLLRHGHEFH